MEVRCLKLGRQEVIRAGGRSPASNSRENGTLELGE